MAPFDGTTYKVNIEKQFSKFPYPKSFSRIQEILDDEKIVSKLLSELDKQISERYKKFNGQDDKYTKNQAMYDIIRETEDAHGFMDKEVKYVMGVLTGPQFYSMMKGPYAFLDPFVTPRHGAETHRIQWWMIAQDIAGNTNKYEDNVQAGALFASTAFKSANNGKENNVWYLTLDALQGKCTSARAPESLKEYIVSNKEYANIAAAEALQMSWDTATRCRYETINPNLKGKGNWLIQRFEKNWELKKYGVSTPDMKKKE